MDTQSQCCQSKSQRYNMGQFCTKICSKHLLMFLLRIKQILNVSKDPACLKCVYVNVLLSTREEICMPRHLQQGAEVELKSRPKAFVVFTVLSCSLSAPSRRSIVFTVEKKKFRKLIWWQPSSSTQFQQPFLLVNLSRPVLFVSRLKETPALSDIYVFLKKKKKKT